MSQTDTPVHVNAAPQGRWADAAPRDLTGITIGDFRVERLLGRGGMGEVYLARQLSLDRPIALKVLKPEMLSNPTYLARFEKEALNAAKLNHPNIVHVYTFSAFDNLKYIAMEYVQGTNLREFLVKKGVPELSLALSIMRQAGSAVAAAAEIGLIHRDIKPENLLMTKKGRVKVADFGLCRAPVGEEAQHLTQEGTTLGTPMYMSPEQVQGKELDPRSDLYSLGVTFYHMLAGFPPFQAETPLALALKHVREKPVDLAVHRPDLPPELCRLVMKLIEKSPADRYQTASGMLRDLARIRETAQVSGATVALGKGTASGATSSVGTPSGQLARGSSVEQAASRERPRPWRAPFRLDLRPGQVTALALVALLAGSALGYMHRTEDLLSRRAPRADGPPGAWLAEVGAIPRESAPEAQYRRAQLETAESEREAAWLAVPTYFPRAKDWGTKSYTQLVRSLFRDGDDAGLEALAAELDGRDRPPADRSLAKVARAAAASLRGDVDALLAAFEETKVELLDPALDELALEAVLHARRGLSGGGSRAERVDRLRDQLLEALQVLPMARAGILRID